MTLLDVARPTWASVCLVGQLTPGRGVAALVDGDAVALFLLDDGTIRAIDNVDPCSGASVLSRGLIGHTDRDGVTVTYVASPLRKERFDLVTGSCLDADASVRTWDVRVTAATVEIARIPSRSSNEPETTP